MKIKTQEFKFNGDKIKTRPIEYRVHWGYYFADSIVTISRGLDHLDLQGRDIPKFIKELQTLVEFMKNDGLLVEDEEEEAKDEDQ